MPQRDAQELLSVWNTHEQRSTWREIVRRGGDNDVAQRVLGEVPDVSALDALERVPRILAGGCGRPSACWIDTI